MSVKKPTSIPLPRPHSQSVRKELELLHARRIAVATLIESLEDYHRFRARRYPLQGLKTA